MKFDEFGDDGGDELIECEQAEIVFYGNQYESKKSYKRYNLKVILLCLKLSTKIDPESIQSTIRIIMGTYLGDNEADYLQIPETLPRHAP